MVIDVAKQAGVELGSMSVSFSRLVVGVESKEIRDRFSKSPGHPLKLFE